jgi:hypothetical protein
MNPAAAMLEAIRNDDADGVRRLLADQPALRDRLNDAWEGLPYDTTPLLAAVARGNRQVIAALLDAGANINQRSHWWAGGFGVLDGERNIDFLIQRGAFIDVHAAARHGMVDRLRELLDGDPQLVHARGGDGQTPLHVARTVEVARLLLDRGADINARDIDHESTPAQYLIRNRRDVVRFLVQRGCRTDLLLAAAIGDLALVRTHIEHNPACIAMTVSDEWFPMSDPRAGGTIYNWTIGRGRCAHHVAQETGRMDILGLLMERSPPDLQLAISRELGLPFDGPLSADAQSE